jgi:TRAP-type C4-dicarboxylate transport system permease small subunit
MDSLPVRGDHEVRKIRLQTVAEQGIPLLRTTNKGCSMDNTYVKKFMKVIESICVILLSIILLSICYQIICRIFHIGQGFTEELSRYAFIIMVFIGSPLVAAEGLHIAVDLLYNALPKSWKRGFDFIDSVLLIVVSVVVLIGAQMLLARNKGIVASSLSWFKMNWAYWAVFFSFVIQIVIALAQIVLTILNKKTTMSLIAEQQALETLEVEVRV